MKPNKSEFFLNNWRPYVWLLLIIFLLYFQTLFFDYTYYDDSTLLADQLDKFSNIANLPSLFTESIFSVLGEKMYYRPVLAVSFMIDTLVGNGSLFIYHLSNILLHCMTVCLIFYLLKKLSSSKKIAFILSVFYAVHPVLTQAVAWIPGRNDSLLALFSLLSVIGFINYIQNGKLYFFVLHLFALTLGIFTKETGIAIPIICVAFYVIINKKYNIRDVFVFGISWLYVIAFWFILRYSVVTNASLSNFYLWGMIKEAAYAFTLYWGKIFLPVNLSVIPIRPDSTIIYGIISIIIFVIILFRLGFKNIRKVLFGAFWFAIFLFPSLILLKDNPIYLEHRLYTPLIGFLIVLSQLHWKKLSIPKGKIGHIVLITIFILFSLQVISHSRNFKNKFAFWDHAVQTSPNSWLTHYNRGIVYGEEGEYETAAKDYKKAIKLNPKHGDSYNNLGEIYATYYARPDSAIKYFEKAIEVAQRYKAYQIKNLAFAYAEAGKFQKAEEAFKYLIRDGMTTPNIYYHLALTHHFRGEKQEALRYCEKALEIDPDFIQAINYIKKERNKE